MHLPQTKLSQLTSALQSWERTQPLESPAAPALKAQSVVSFAVHEFYRHFLTAFIHFDLASLPQYNMLNEFNEHFFKIASSISLFVWKRGKKHRIRKLQMVTIYTLEYNFYFNEIFRCHKTHPHTHKVRNVEQREEKSISSAIMHSGSS